MTAHVARHRTRRSRHAPRPPRLPRRERHGRLDRGACLALRPRRPRGFPAGAAARRRAARAPFRAQGQAGDLSLSVGRPLTDRALGPEAGPRVAAWHRSARLDPHGPAAHRHDERAEELPRDRLEVWLQALRRGRHARERIAPAHRPDRRPALHRAVDAHRGDQPRSRDHVSADRLAAAGAGFVWRLAQLRPRLGGRRPAELRRDALAGQRRRLQPGPARAALGGGLPAVEPSGREAPRGRRPGALSQRPAGRDAAAASLDARRPLAAARHPAGERRRSRDRLPRGPIRDGLPHAGLGAGAHRPFGRVGSHV